MVKRHGTARSVSRQLAWKLMTGAAIVTLAAGCSRLSKKDAPLHRLSAIDSSKQASRSPLKPNHPLYIATAHWAKQHQKNPRDPKAALNYAVNLKALGSKSKALDVLARTYQLNPGHGALASEYGRLALGMGKVQVAEPLLNQAMRSKNAADWRVLSALGTVNAKRGDHRKAQSYYMAALRKKPNSTSVFNNLALSYALDGKVGDAEKLLKNAVAKGHNTQRIRQNLALVLGLQSKFGEAQQIAKIDLDSDKIENNKNYLRSMVKPSKVASAAKKSGTGKAKVDTMTTASLPARKSAAKTPRVAAKASQKHEKAKTASALAGKQTNRAKPVKAASTRTAVHPKRIVQKPSKVRVAVLPWHKKPAAAAPTRTASLKVQPAKAPIRITPKAKVDWNVTVNNSIAVKTEPVKTQAPKKSWDFSFPTDD